MARALPVILGIALAIYAVADCARTPSDQVPGRVPKPLWIVLILLVTFVGPIAWIVASRVSQAESHGGTISRGVWSSDDGLPLFGRGNSREPEQVPPDDDPDFLFALEAQLYRERKERERQEREAQQKGKKDGASGPGGGTDAPGGAAGTDTPNGGDSDGNGSADGPHGGPDDEGDTPTP
ncbi:MAG: PLD nuclease N-terminal domain-containing protein [Actinomycetaceae bacterium]|nr:PLD nuclease N-terminal domain-containing protein [Actinomycetaceae bacterium]MDU0970804.1 PLD nuclease N-terminal domain-containing protein [Actinomycetaceae bacterium]